MTSMPGSGRIDCTRCYGCANAQFDITRREADSWRITANPLAWGNSNPEIIVLGFSKGPTQAGALARTRHDEIAYKGSRGNVGKILAHVGLLDASGATDLARAVDRLITDQHGRFHFGSLIRCTVERFDEKSQNWKGSGGGMLDKFVAAGFGKEVAANCVKEYLGSLPSKTKLIVMFGLGSKQNYVREANRLFKAARPGNWRWINEIAYTDGEVTVVHVEHFASQGALIPNWLGQKNHERAKFGVMAREAVTYAM